MPTLCRTVHRCQATIDRHKGTAFQTTKTFNDLKYVFFSVLHSCLIKHLKNLKGGGGDRDDYNPTVPRGLALTSGQGWSEVQVPALAPHRVLNLFLPGSPKFLPFLLPGKPNQYAQPRRSAPSVDHILGLRHIYHYILSFLVYFHEMFLYRLTTSVSKITKSLITDCWVGKFIFFGWVFFFFFGEGGHWFGFFNAPSFIINTDHITTSEAVFSHFC